MNKEPNIQLIGARVLIKEKKATGETSTGIILTGAKEKATNRGTVIAVGPGAILENGDLVPMSVKPGDEVLFPAYAGHPIKVNENDDETYLIIIERDLLGILKA